MPSNEATSVPQLGPASGDYEPVVEVRGLTKRYGDHLAVDRLSFSLARGTITGFVGPNGAGKTTTMRLLLGLARPSAGEALVFGSPYRALERPASRVGAVLESSDFDLGRSGRNHLRCLARAMSIGDDRVDDLLELVGVADAANRPVRGYSLGMRQRLGLATALLGNPDLLVLDEPANGLDAAGVHWLRTSLRHLASNGKTVLVSSHLLAELSQTVDGVVIIDRGRLLAQRHIGELDGAPGALERYYLDLIAKEPT